MVRIGPQFSSKRFRHWTGLVKSRDAKSSNMTLPGAFFMKQNREIHKDEQTRTQCTLGTYDWFESWMHHNHNA